MGTANYDFTYLEGGNTIDLVGDTTTFLDEIDSTIHEVSANLDSEISKIPTKRKFILIGDSFSVGVSPNVEQADWKGWIYYFEQVYGSDNVYTVQDAGVQVLEGVSGFVTSLPFLTMLQAVSAIIENKDVITDIVVMGGTNDLPYMSQVPAAIETFMEYCKTNYANATVRLGMIGTAISSFAKNENYYKNIENYGGIYMPDSMCAYFLPAYISSDGTHLTQDGYAFYKQHTNNLILNGTACYNWKGAEGLTPSDTNIATWSTTTGKEDLVLYYDITPDTTTIRIGSYTGYHEPALIDMVGYKTYNDISNLNISSVSIASRLPRLTQADIIGNVEYIYKVSSSSTGGVDVLSNICQGIVYISPSGYLCITRRGVGTNMSASNITQCAAMFTSTRTVLNNHFTVS